jgi:hypothetical protein
MRPVILDAEQTDTGFRLKRATAADRQYQLERTTTVDGGFESIGDPIFATSTTATTEDTFPNSAETYYRVRALE